MKKFGVQKDERTKATVDLRKVMLRDSGHIQEMDAECGIGLDAVEATREIHQK